MFFKKKDKEKEEYLISTLQEVEGNVEKILSVQENLISQMNDVILYYCKLSDQYKDLEEMLSLISKDIVPKAKLKLGRPKKEK